jgi:hypothetical protein
MGASLDKFKLSLQLAQSLNGIEKNSCSNPPRSDEQENVEALRGGAAVLSVASLENFLRVLFENSLSRLSTNPPPVNFNDLPDKLKVSSTYYSLESALKGPKYGIITQRIDRIPNIIAASRSTGHIINPKVLAETGANPNSTNVKRMFSDIGVSDIFGQLRNDFETKWGSPQAATFVQDKLDEIVNRRHVVAHTANALNISRSDLRETFKFLLILAELLEVNLELYVDSIIN